VRRAETLPADRAAPSVGRVPIPGVRRIAFAAAGRRLLMASISIGFALLLWHLSVGTLFNPALVPTPEQTFSKAWRMMLTGELFMHVAVSMRRVLVGYAVGCVVGIAVGALIGRVRIVRELADPLLELIRPISPVAIVPLAMLWFGIGELSKFFVIIYATVIIVLLNTAAGVSRTPVTRIRAARCLGASEYEVFVKIILPSAVPYVLTGMRVALGFSFMGIVAAELIGASEGLGFLIMNSQMLLQTDQLFVGLLSLGVVGLVVDRIFRAVLARSMRRYMQFLGDV
jgi:ABC-type nitrate/sulfonate/bicarbonate transport system permease component